MSSYLSRFSTTVDEKRTRRSESRTRMPEVKERRRVPAIKMDEEKDVTTLVCVELSRAILANPDISMGVFMRTSSNARRDLSISDATLVITAAILEHLGNQKMSLKVLERSSTITSYYSKLGLTNSVTREMFVTILFALNPNFVEMVEKMLKIVIDRSSAQGMEAVTDNQVDKALIRLDSDNTITRSELVSSHGKTTALEKEATVVMRKGSIQITPTELIGPSDSASVSTERPRKRSTVNERDLINYVGRRRSGREPEFEEVFTRSRPPVALNNNKNRMGLGFDHIAISPNAYINRANQILGSQTIKSFNIRTGDSRDRRPSVEDYLETQSIADTVLRSPPDVATDVEHNYTFTKVPGPAYTESFLPDSVVEEIPETRKVPRPVDSLEELFRDLDLKSSSG
jgi:hypothetical protein